ncbi:hypothetical protein V7S43_003709 [Phytophthora oleae]|uniref:Uncharacterized protein n=1 Tax=Phytophthora oleae TaxID=2107226 RepID=A0ABD3G1M0_9STRA
MSDVKCPDFQPTDEGLTHVELVLRQEQQLRDRNQVFFMLNGQNEDVYMPWAHQPSDQACILELAQMAALSLSADPDLLVNGIKLLSVDGLPILTADALDAQRIAHVLLDGQLWV